MHSEFAHALMHPEAPCPEGLTAWNGSDPQHRFAVYRNNVMVSLVDALVATFDVTHALVGDDFFRHMARQFLRGQTRRARVLTWLGLPFPDFIAQEEAAASVPYLADVARLEMARVVSTHAADHMRMPAEHWTAFMTDPAQLAQAQFELAPCVQLLQSPWAMVSIWAAHQVDENQEVCFDGIDISQGEFALVFRQDEGVRVLGIDAAGHRFFQCLQQGQGLAQAVQEAVSVNPTFELPTALSVLIAHGLVVRSNALQRL